MVKTFFHFTLVRCSTVTRCKSSPPSLWSEPSASSSYYTKTRYCQLHGRRCSANSQFSQDRLLRLLMPENRFQLGKRKIAFSWVNALPVLRWRSSLPRLVTTIQAKVILASFWLSGCTYGFSTQRHLGSVVDTGDRLPDRKLRLYFSCKDRNRQSWNVLS